MNGETLRYVEFERRIGALTPYARARYATLEARQGFLDRQIDFELLADYAEERGYADRPEVVHAMKETMVRQMLHQELFQTVRKTDIPDAEIEALFQANIDRYERPEYRQAKVAIFPDEATAIKTRQEFGSLEQVPEEQQKDWENLGFIEDPAWPRAQNTGRNKKLAEVLFALPQTGEISEAFRFGEQWALATYVQRKPSKKTKFSDVRDEIQNKLYLQKRQDARNQLVEKLRTQAKIEIHEDVLKKAAPPPKGVGRPIKSDLPVRDLSAPMPKDTAKEARE